MQPYCDGVVAAQHEKLWGFIDTPGVWIIEPRYQWVRKFRNGRARVGEPRWRGGSYIDKKGAVVWRSADGGS